MKNDLDIEPIMTSDGLTFHFKTISELDSEYKNSRAYKFSEFILRAVLKQSDEPQSKIKFTGDVESFTSAVCIILELFQDYEKYIEDVSWASIMSED